MASFKYLVALDAVKIDIERFNSSLKETERYLNEGNWILAGYLANRIMKDYSDLIRERWKERERSGKGNMEDMKKKQG